MDIEIRPASQKWFDEATPVNYAKSTAVIGSGTNGTVTITKDELEVDDNGYSVDVVVPDEDGDMSVELVGKVLTVTLGTGAAESAVAEIGSGTDGTIELTIDKAGADGNDYTVEVVEGDPSEAMSAALVEKDLTITLAMDAGAKASTTIGAGQDGVVTITADDIGDAGNDFTIAVEQGAVNSALSATIDGDDITVSLAMTNVLSASATIGSGEDGEVFVVYGTAGESGNSKTIEVVKAGYASAPLSVSYMGNALVVSLGTGGDGDVDDAKNQASSISGLINLMGDVPFSAVASGNGSAALAIEAEQSFLGGAASTLNTAANTANLIAAEIADLAGVTATASGTGEDSISSTVERKSLSGGLDSAPVTGSNTAELIAAEINLLSGITAVATGTGLSSLSSAESKKNFEFGTDIGVNGAENTATLIAAEISSISGFTAVKSGNGNSSLSEEETVEFTDGAWGTPCPQAGITLDYTSVDGYYYTCIKSDNTRLNNGWRKYIPATF
jgi:hypothetical protein